MPAIMCVPLISASPSFGFQLNQRQGPRRAQGFPCRHGVMERLPGRAQPRLSIGAKFHQSALAGHKLDVGQNPRAPPFRTSGPVATDMKFKI
jgi:hypothetical protein